MTANNLPFLKKIKDKNFFYSLVFFSFFIALLSLFYTENLSYHQNITAFEFRRQWDAIQNDMEDIYESLRDFKSSSCQEIDDNKGLKDYFYAYFKDLDKTFSDSEKKIKSLKEFIKQDAGFISLKDSFIVHLDSLLIINEVSLSKLKNMEFDFQNNITENHFVRIHDAIDFIKKNNKNYLDIMNSSHEFQLRSQIFENEFSSLYLGIFSNYKNHQFIFYFIFVFFIIWGVCFFLFQRYLLLENGVLMKRHQEDSESDDIFRNLLVSLDQAFFYLDSSFHVIDINKKALELFKEPADNIIGASLEKFVDPLDLALFRDWVTNEQSLLRSPKKEIRFLKSLKDPFIAQIFMKHIKNKKNGFFICFIKDISEMKYQEEKNLQEKQEASSKIFFLEKIFQAILAETKEGIFILDKKGEIQSFSHSIYEIFGYEGIDIHHYSIKEIISEFHFPLEDSSNLERKKTLSLGEVTKGVSFKKNGETIFLELCLHKIEDKDHFYFLLFVKDLTGLKIQSERIHYHDEMLSLISETQHRSLSQDLKEKNIFFNEILEKIINLTGGQSGFLGCLAFNQEKKQMMMCVSSDLRWNHENQQFSFSPELGVKENLLAEETHLNWLFSRTLNEKKAIVSPNVSGGTILNSYVGIPIFRENDFLGVLGILNPSSFAVEDIPKFLEPLLRTLSHFIYGEISENLRIKAEVDVKNFFNMTRFFKNIFDSLPNAVILKNREGKVIEANAAFWDSVKTYHEEDKQKLVYNVFPFSNKDLEKIDFGENYMSPIEKKDISITNVHGESKNFTVFQRILNDAKEGIFIIQIMEDMTDFRKVEENLRQQKDLFLSVLNTSNFSIISTDTQGVIKVFNRAAERLLGYDAEEMIDKKIPSIFHDHKEIEDYARTLSQEFGKEIEPGFRSFVERAEKEGKDEREWTYIRKDGECFSVLLSVSAIKGLDGVTEGYLGVAADITTLKNVQQELNFHKNNLEILVQEKTAEFLKAKEEADLANQAKSEFFSNVSHELRTPMHAILNYSILSLESLQSSSVDTQKVTTYIGKIKRSGQRLLSLINSILELSKMENKKMVFQLMPQDLRESVDESIEELSSLIEEKKLEIVIKENTYNFIACLDKLKMIQLIVNILSNAIKFSPAGKKITLTYDTGLIQEGDKKIESLNLIIDDQGAGIPSEELEIIFAKFIQSSATKTGAGGTGLGLAICKEIMEGHFGKIWAENNKEGGARFTIAIPRRCKSVLGE